MQILIDQQKRQLDCFLDILRAAQYALDNLPNIATHETIGSMAYQETRMELLLAIEKFGQYDLGSSTHSLSTIDES